MIRNLHLLNFKCFQECDLRIGPLTLLTGANGSGKSSAIQALLVLRQSHDQKLLVENRLALNGEYARLGRATDVLYDGAEKEEIAVDLQAEAWSTPFSIRVAYEKGAEVLHGLVGEPHAMRLADEALFAEAFHYVGADRVAPRTAFDLSEVALRRRSVGVRGEFAPQFLARFGTEKLSVPQLHHERASSPALRDEVEAWLSHISPGTRIEATEYPSLDAVHIGFKFSRADEVSQAFRPTNVGFGLTYTLPVLVAILSAPRGSLVILENPEAHLHPKGQTLMGEMISRAADGGVQVICETHSDHVLNGVRLSVARGLLKPSEVSVHFFARSAAGRHGVVSPTIDKRGRLDQWPEDFFDQWDKSLEALLTLGDD